MGSRGFEFLEHTSDVYVRAYGRDLAEALEEAGKALFAVLVRNAEVSEPRREVEVTARGYDKMSLLYDWLERLLLVFQLEKLVASEVKVTQIAEETGGAGGEGEGHRRGLQPSEARAWDRREGADLLVDGGERGAGGRGAEVRARHLRVGWCRSRKRGGVSSDLHYQRHVSTSSYPAASEPRRARSSRGL
jgi:SHS2 domain-containing protein